MKTNPDLLHAANNTIDQKEITNMLGKQKKKSVSGDLRKDFSFWFGEPTEVFGGTSSADPSLNEWDWYIQNMISEHNPEDTSDNNIVIGKFPGNCRYSGDVKLSMNPKQTGKNLNTLVLGDSGTGKRFRFLEPNIARMNASYIISDPGGNTFQDTNRMLIDHGYKVYLLNTKDPSHSHCYNPLDYIYDQYGKVSMPKVTTLVNTVWEYRYHNQEHEGGDSFRDQSAKAWLTFAVIYVTDFLPEDQRNLYYVMKLAQLGKSDEEHLDRLIKQAKFQNPRSKCFEFYDIYAIAPAKTRASVLISIEDELSIFCTDEIANLTSTDYKCKRNRDGLITEYTKNKNGEYIRTEANIDLTLVGQQKVALFLISPTADQPCKILQRMLCVQLLDILQMQALNNKQQTLPVHVSFFMDEFTCDSMWISPDSLAVMRSCNISVTFLISNLTQLEAMYKENTEMVLGNCDIIVFMGGSEVKTCNFVSWRLGKTLTQKTITVQGPSDNKHQWKSIRTKITSRPLCSIAQLASLPKNECIVMIRGLNPMKLRKLDIIKHPETDEEAIANESGRYSKEFMPICSCKKYVPREKIAVEEPLKDVPKRACRLKGSPINNEEDFNQAMGETPASDNIFTLLSGCTDDRCQEPTKSQIAFGSRFPFTSEDYRKYGKHVNVYYCKNTACFKHPRHTITLSELASFLKIKNPDKASKKDVLHAVIEIIEAEPKPDVDQID